MLKGVPHTEQGVCKAVPGGRQQGQVLLLKNFLQSHRCLCTGAWLSKSLSPVWTANSFSHLDSLDIYAVPLSLRGLSWKPLYRFCSKQVNLQQHLTSRPHTLTRHAIIPNSISTTLLTFLTITIWTEMLLHLQLKCCTNELALFFFFFSYCKRQKAQRMHRLHRCIKHCVVDQVFREILGRLECYVLRPGVRPGHLWQAPHYEAGKTDLGWGWPRGLSEE